MSGLVVGGVALAYASTVVTAHRVAVARRRALAQGYPTLGWLDWDTLLQGVMPVVPEGPASTVVPIEGGPPPVVLARPPSQEQKLLLALVAGDPVSAESFAEAKFSGGEAHWLGLLSVLREEPLEVLVQLEASEPDSPAHAYLREWLTHQHLVNVLNLELVTFSSKQRVNRALARFGDHPALFFARARASSLLGLSRTVVDDLARAVYFSGQARFYLDAVVEMPFVEEVRPALALACREARAQLP